MDLNKSILITLSSYLLLSPFTNAARILKPKPPVAKPISEPSFDAKYGTLSFINLPPPSKVDGHLNSICGMTKNPQTCVSLVAPHLKGKATAVSTLEVIIGMLKVYTKETSNFATDIIKEDKSISLKVKSSIDVTLQHYRHANENLVRVTASFVAPNMDQVQALLGVYVANLGQSNKAFQEQGLKNWPLKDANNALIQYAGFGIDIAAKYRKISRH